MRWAKVVDQTRCIGCHACSTACKSENQVPLGVHRTYVKYVDVGPLPAGAARLPGHALQPVRRAALRLRLPDRGDVPAAGRDRRLRQARLHRLQGLHRRVPLRRDLHQPRGPLGREVQLLRAAPRRRPRARLRRRVPDRGDPGRRPERRHLARVARSSAATSSRCAGPRRRRGRSSSTRARTRRRSTRSPRAGPPGGLFLWSEQGERPAAGDLRPSRRCPTTPPRRCSPTTSRTARPGTSASASTRGRRASRRAPTCVPALLLLAGVLEPDERALALGGAGRRRRLPRGDRRRC